MKLLTKQKETHRLRKWTYGCWGEGIVRDFGKVICIRRYLKWITNRMYCTVHGTLLNVVCQLRWEGVWGRMDRGIRMAESFCCSSETTTTLLTSYIPIQNLKKFKVWKKNYHQVPLSMGSQARILEWVAIFFFRGSSQPRDWTHISCTGKQILHHWATGETPLVIR